MKDHNRIKEAIRDHEDDTDADALIHPDNGNEHISARPWMTVNGAESVVTEANSERLQTDDAKLADAQTASDEDSVNAAENAEASGTKN